MTDKRPIKREDVPEFATEAEEAAFWAEHELGEDILADMGPPPDDLLPPPRGSA